MKKLIRLTEGGLHRIIENSVHKVLNEMDWKTYMNAAKKSYGRHKNGDEKENRYTDFTDAAKNSFMKKHSALNYNDKKNGEIEAFGNPNHQFNANFYDKPYVNPYDKPFLKGNGNDLGPKVTADITDNHGPSNDSYPYYAARYNNFHSDPDMRRGYGTINDWDDEGVPMSITKNRNIDYPNYSDKIGTRNNFLYKLGDAYNDINNYNTGKSKYIKGKGWSTAQSDKGDNGNEEIDKERQQEANEVVQYILEHFDEIEDGWNFKSLDFYTEERAKNGKDFYEVHFNKGWYIFNPEDVKKYHKLLIDIPFDKIHVFSNGFAKVRKDGKYNFVSTNGKLISPNLWFDKAAEIYGDSVRVEKDGKWNAINTKGQFEFPIWRYSGR